MEINYLTIPGFGNSGSTHWQSHFERSVNGMNRILQKNWYKPICGDWVSSIENKVEQYEPESVVLISHSLGGIALVHWANKFKRKIKGALIVAPPDLEYPWQDLDLESFVPIPFSRLPFESTVVASTNDNWISIERAQYFAQSWGSKLITIENAGHINSASGYGEWIEGLMILKDII